MDAPPSAEARLPGSVLVGVDGSRHALAATRWAAAESAARRTPLVIAHAAPGVRRGLDQAATRHGQALLARARVEAEHALGRDLVHTRLIDAEPVAGLTELSEDAALLVLGLTGSGSSEELLLGSTTHALAGKARCPLVGVRRWPLPEPEHRFVLVGVDEVLADADAIALAFELAARANRTLVALHAVHGPLGNDSEDNQRARLWAALRGWRMRYPRVAVLVECPRGAPATELLRRAAEAEAVVLGSRGRGALARTVLGSTSRTVLRYGPVPTLVVGPDTLTGHRRVRAGSSEDPRALTNLG